MEYPASSLGWEIPIILIYPVIQIGRLVVGFRGNKTENYSMTAIFLGMCLLSIGLQLVLFLAQTYVYFCNENQHKNIDLY